jgi:hypothetical protein
MQSNRIDLSKPFACRVKGVEVWVDIFQHGGQAVQDLLVQRSVVMCHANLSWCSW